MLSRNAKTASRAVVKWVVELIDFKTYD